MIDRVVNNAQAALAVALMGAVMLVAVAPAGARSATVPSAPGAPTAQAGAKKRPRLHCNSARWRRHHPRLRKRCPKKKPHHAPPPILATPPPPIPAPATPVGGTPLTVWTAPGTPPVSDAEARALVRAAPETRPDNATANAYVPSPEQVAAFREARINNGQTTVQWNPLYRYVDGWDGLTSPTTDELVQWAAHKWGIPEDWIRAVLVQESYWRMGTLSDRSKVSSSWYALYPPAAQISGGSEVYESMGISQVKWIPDGTVGAGTEPLRWLSTAFNLDYYAATVRYYFDGYCHWCHGGYSAGQEWNSIGAWFSPYPWNEPEAQEYVASVQHELAARRWAQPGF